MELDQPTAATVLRQYNHLLPSPDMAFGTYLMGVKGHGAYCVRSVFDWSAERVPFRCVFVVFGHGLTKPGSRVVADASGVQSPTAPSIRLGTAMVELSTNAGRGWAHSADDGPSESGS